jgi:hypothetical protein
MYIKTYKVYRAKTGETFTKPFTVEHSTRVECDDGVPYFKALEFVNEWNRNNSELGFTYWIA